MITIDATKVAQQIEDAKPKVVTMRQARLSTTSKWITANCTQMP
jgi:hypothetical protein